MELNTRQFEYRKKVEKEYEQRITNLLTPIAGLGKVKVQAAVELDFSRVEESRESWKPDAQVLRSEQVSTDRKNAAAGAGGVPGALANQPPGDGGTNTDNTAAESSSITRNYEIERVLNYTARPAGDIQRLSVAVVLDDSLPEDAPNDAQAPQYSDAQLEKLASLVRDAVGFNAERGDRVTVITANFQPARIDSTAPDAPAFWEQAWFVSILKQVLTGIAVILIVFTIFRPSIKTLMQSQLPVSAVSGTGGGVDGAVYSRSDLNPAVAALGAPGSVKRMEDSLDAIRDVADQDPKLVAQVVKNWIARDGK